METCSQLFLLLVLSNFLLFTFCFSSSASEVVLDTNGDAIQAEHGYSILTVNRGRGGGLTMAGIRHYDDENCPPDVVLEEEARKAMPVMFSPATRESGAIQVSTDLNVRFLGLTTCMMSTVWRLQARDGQYIVTTGGKAGNPGRDTVPNWFKIEKFESDYKIAFCPTVCNDCSDVICRDVGVYLDDSGKSRLALSDVPLKVRFRKG